MIDIKTIDFDIQFNQISQNRIHSPYGRGNLAKCSPPTLSILCASSLSGALQALPPWVVKQAAWSWACHHQQAWTIQQTQK